MALIGSYKVQRTSLAYNSSIIIVTKSQGLTAEHRWWTNYIPFELVLYVLMPPDPFPA